MDESAPATAHQPHFTAAGVAPLLGVEMERTVGTWVGTEGGKKGRKNERKKGKRAGQDTVFLFFVFYEFSNVVNVVVYLISYC